MPIFYTCLTRETKLTILLRVNVSAAAEPVST